MFHFLRDKLQTVRLKARYERLVQERILNLLESSGPQPVSEDPGGWIPLGESNTSPAESDRVDLRAQARKLVIENPHARNLLRLLEIYVAGPGLRLNHVSTRDAEEDAGLIETADRLWEQFLEANRRHFSYREYARRTWRDGECFLRLFPTPHPTGLGGGVGTSRGGVWPPAVRFVDPERIGPTVDRPEWVGSGGILTEPDDVETPLAYLKIDPESGELQEEIAAEEMLHTKIGVDSNQKRGLTIFAPVVRVLSCFEKWMETELQARKLQASIVLWRKVQGSPSQAASLADAAQSPAVNDPCGPGRRERYRPGTILTTSQGTDLEFLQPKTNFGDAVPLGRLLLLSTAAGAGLPEFMLTADASNANFASTMVAEGPAVKLFESEQRFFAGEFARLWRRVTAAAVERQLLPGDFFERAALNWSFPQLVNRDRPRERLADVQLVRQRILSRAEVARRDDASPAQMQKEIEQEARREEC